MSVDLVISRYNESLKWISVSPFVKHRKFIYNKGPSLNLGNVIGKNDTIVDLLNVGREGHTYLHHIIQNYDHLADVTVFLPGSCMNEHKSYHTLQLMSKVAETNDTSIFGKWYSNVCSNLKNFAINTWKGTSTENNQLSYELSCQPSQIARPYGSWYKHYFPDTVIHVVSYTSMFAVSRAHIHQHDVEYYRSLLKSLETHANPEDGHFIERSWVAVFHPIPEHCLFAARPVHAHTSDSNSITSSSGSSSSTITTDKAVAKVLSSKQSMSSLFGLYGNKTVEKSADMAAEAMKQDDKNRDSRQQQQQQQQSQTIVNNNGSQSSRSRSNDCTSRSDNDERNRYRFHDNDTHQYRHDHNSSSTSNTHRNYNDDEYRNYNRNSSDYRHRDEGGESDGRRTSRSSDRRHGHAAHRDRSRSRDTYENRKAYHSYDRQRY